MSDELRDQLDALCGGPGKRAAYMRVLLKCAINDRQPAQDEAGEAIAEHPPTTPKESIVIGPGDKGVRYEPRSGNAGTLVVNDEYEMDLVGVELEKLPTGEVRILFSNRSLVRNVQTEVG